MKSLDYEDIVEQTVILRVDLNVPVSANKIIDNSRIDSIIPTVTKLQKNRNKIFLISHYGRPKGKINKELSLKFICPTIKEILGLKKIYFLETINENEIKNIINKMSFNDICLIENIRFYPEEEENNLIFAKNISKNFDVYVNDAFSASHRNHASIVGIPNFLPAYAGLSFIKEIKNINLFINNLEKPNIAIIGGSKVSTKINLLYNLIEKCDVVVIGGAMANTFLKAKGFNLGLSLLEKDLISTALLILQEANKVGCKILLPTDVVCGDSLYDKKNINECDIKNISSSQMVLDIGTNTVKEITSKILSSNAVLWNGPLGAFEYSPFEKSSFEIIEAIRIKTASGIPTIAGGGDTLAVIKMANAYNSFSYISNAGGAFLEWLESQSSPGFEILKNNRTN